MNPASAAPTLTSIGSQAHWTVWIVLGTLGLASLTCFIRSYAHLTPEAGRSGSRFTLKGALTRQDIFTQRGWELRLWGWALAGVAMLGLAVMGVWAARQSP